MPTDPLSPQQIDALLRPDPRATSRADMLVLRDALLRLGDAWERLAAAAGALHAVADDLTPGRRPPRADERGEIEGPGVPERAD